MNVLNVTVTPPQPLQGNVGTIAGTFSQAGLVTDPASVTLVVTDPTSASTTYVWPGPPVGPQVALTRDTVGTFHADQSIASGKDGVWTFTWTLTGPSFTQTSGFVVPPLLQQMTITVNDPTPLPIVGVGVQAFLSPQQVEAGGKTNLSGQVVLFLPPGDYNVELSKTKVAFTNPYALTVADSNLPQTATLVGTPLTIPETGEGKFTKLYGHIIDMSGHPKEAVRVQVETVGYSGRSLIQPATGTETGTDPQDLMVAAEKRELVTDGTGYWECDVLQDSSVRVEIPDMRYDKLFRVPIDANNPTTPLLNINDARTDPGPGAYIGIDSDVGTLSSLKSPG
jgi:hypothetical protein